MERNGNFNVNGSRKASNINVKVERQKRLRALKNAEHLQQKFGSAADNSLGFLRKCFNRMSEDKVWQLYESAMRKDAGIINPFAYFIGAAKAQPEMNGTSNRKKYVVYRNDVDGLCTV